MIYFDNSATTRPYPEVLDTFRKVSLDYFANPSSLHLLGSESERLLWQARQMIAKQLEVDPEELLFTSGGTEGNNLSIKGVALQYCSRGKHLITTCIEHASSLKAFKQLEQLGYEVSYLSVDKSGRISLDELQKELRNDTILVSIMHVNNEVGTIQPIEEVGELLKSYPKTLFHVDHVQGITKVPLSLKRAHIDLCTMSAHKFHGLKGTGMLYVRRGVQLTPLLHGGMQEFSMRAGTENVAGVVAMAKALRMTNEKAKTNSQSLQKINQYLREKVASLGDILINSPKDYAAPHILNISFLNIKPEVLVHALGKREIYASTKSACSSKSTDVSPILVALGFDDDRAKSAIRFSFSYDNTMDEAQKVVKALEEIVPKLQKVMR